jgi:hypothetical protein
MVAYQLIGPAAADPPSERYATGKATIKTMPWTFLLLSRVFE